MDLFFIFYFLGRFDEPEVQRDIKFLPYKVVNKDGMPYIQVKVKGETKVFSPEEISAMVLGKMKETAEQYLGKKIKDAVVTVPGIELNSRLSPRYNPLFKHFSSVFSLIFRPSLCNCDNKFFLA